MKSTLEAILAYRPAVLQSTQSCTERYERASGDGLQWSRDVARQLRSFATAGKLLRGCLVCYSYGLCSGETIPPRPVLDTAAALELSHAAFLIHDDIIDQDDVRRGQPALQWRYRQLFSQSRAARHLGNSLALCAGDLTLLMAFELLGTVRTNGPEATALSALLARELTTVCAGQMQDVYASGNSGHPTKREIYELMRAKSAGYSVAFPLKAGAILAGQSATMQRQLYALGIAAGTMFQIRDDELGVLGDSDKLGKPVGSDIRENKKTLLNYYLRRAVRGTERQRLEMIFGNPKASPEDIAFVRTAMLRHNIPSRLEADLGRLKQTADRYIKQLALSPSGRQELRQLVEFCGSREA